MMNLKTPPVDNFFAQRWDYSFFSKQARYWKDFQKCGSVSGYITRCVILEFNFSRFVTSLVKSG